LTELRDLEADVVSLCYLKTIVNVSARQPSGFAGDVHGICIVRSYALRFLAGSLRDPSRYIQSSLEAKRDTERLISILQGIEGNKIAIKGLLEAMACLSNARFSSSKFNILVKEERRPHVARVTPISQTLLQQLDRLLMSASEMLAAILHTVDSGASGVWLAVQKALEPIEDSVNGIMQYLGLKWTTPYCLDPGHPPYFWEIVVDSCSTLTLILIVGIVSYSGSHLHRFDETYLEGNWAGFIFPYPCGNGGILLKQQNLACLGDFVGGPVWTFQRVPENPDLLALTPSLHISTYLDDLRDLWGPAYTIPAKANPEHIRQINVERGVIVVTRYIPANIIKHNDVEIECHWYSWKEFATSGQFRFTFHPMQRLLIGGGGKGRNNHKERRRTFRTNPNCKGIMSELPGWGCNIAHLGVDRGRLELDHLQFSGGISQIVGVGYQASFKRMSARTLKGMIELEWNKTEVLPDPLTLDLSMGLEISACTGNARRVKIWELLKHDGVMKLIERCLTSLELGSDALDINAFMSNLRMALSKDFLMFLDSWARCHRVSRIQRDRIYGDLPFQVTNPNHGKAIRLAVGKVVRTLCQTGVDSDGFLRAWWVDGGQQYVLKLDPKKHRWVNMLKDTEHAGTFAIVVGNCYEHSASDGIRCLQSTGASKATREGQRTVLRTAICLNPPSKNYKSKLNQRLTDNNVLIV
jgi:hypothetical protein